MKFDDNTITHNSTIQLDRLKPIRIVECTPGTYVTVKVYDAEHFRDIYIEDIFYPDADREVLVDIKDFATAIIGYDDSFVGQLSESTPKVARLQDGSIMGIDIVARASDADTDIAIRIYVTKCQISNSPEEVSDIECIEVPRDYILAMSFPAGFANADGQASIQTGSDCIHIDIDNYPDEEDGGATYETVDVLCRLKDAGFDTDIPEEMTVVIPNESGDTDLPSSVSSPKLIFSDKHFEQYLFRNRYGALDNIPMHGARKFVPEYSLETGTLGESLVGIAKESTKAFSQDTGYLPRKTIAALSELLKSGSIYHLRNGVFRKIVITGTTLNLSSAETVHNASFTYRYADESEPMKLI